MYNETTYLRERILLTAIDLVHEFGIHYVSTKEIAKRLAISESTIFKHYPRKIDLLMSVLNQFALYDNDIYSTAETQKQDPVEAILFYIDSYVIYYENYPPITALIQAYELVRGIPELEENAKSIFEKRFRFMRKLILKAQESGAISLEADTDSLTDIFTSTCRGICLKWRLSNFAFPLREKTMETVRMLINAFSVSPLQTM